MSGKNNNNINSTTNELLKQIVRCCVDVNRQLLGLLMRVLRQAAILRCNVLYQRPRVVIVEFLWRCSWTVLRFLASFRMGDILDAEGCYHVANNCLKQTLRCVKYLDLIPRTNFGIMWVGNRIVKSAARRISRCRYLFVEFFLECLCSPSTRKWAGCLEIWSDAMHSKRNPIF